MKRLLVALTAGILATSSLAASSFAQNSESKAESKSEAKETAAKANPHFCDMRDPHTDCVLKTYFLANTFEQNDANEILIALRNVLDPSDRIYLISSERAIELLATPDQQATAQRVITELDRPRKAYRLTFTLADSDNGKRSGVQHFSINVVAGQRTTLKQGSRIPIITGTYGKESDPQQTQFQYLDIGMNFDATLEYTPGGLLLKSKVEQSSLADEHMSGPLAPEPIVRQTTLEGTSLLTPGKPLTLGSVDVPGSTRHIDIEVVAEPVS